MNNYNILSAFILSLIAGLSTGLGGCIALFAKNSNTKFLTFALGFSAGVMIYISMVEILYESKILLNISFGNKIGSLLTIIVFFSGMIITKLINKMVPHDKYKSNNFILKTIFSEWDYLLPL